MKTTPTPAEILFARKSSKRIQAYILQRSTLPGSSLGVRSSSRGKPVVLTVVGKGRFGKRPLPLTTNGYHHSSDNSNSNDSGCDSNSESQFWLSSDDSRSRSATFAISNFQATSTQNSSEQKFTEGNKLHENFLNKSIESYIQPKVEPLSTVPTFSENTSTDMLFKKIEIDEDSTDYSAKTAPISSVSAKRPRYNFPSKSGNGLKLRNQNQSQNGNTRTTIGKRFPLGAAASLSSPLSSTSQDGSVQLQILTEPEEQHRARYQTEGSRGAIKDRKGNGFPSVKLVGYKKPSTLQIFIGTDQGKVSPHMFYQVCKVTGKSSTPCIEKKLEGTIVIEIDFEPSKEMIIGCDCVGILKERNVDVEQRFPFHHAAASRKKSTKCRLIFRTTIINSDGIEETLQATSLPIVCTQPPGQPEISKKSHVGYPAKGGLELLVFGKNFLKDTKLIIQEESLRGDIMWEARAGIQKDHLQQNHFSCLVPPFKDQNIITPVECRLTISSGGKCSEPQRFMYIPNCAAAYYDYLAEVSHDIAVSLPPMPSLACSPRSQHQLSVEEPQDSFLSGIPTTETLTNSLIETSTEASVAALAALGPALQSPLSISYENSMSPTTAQEARQVVNDLQTLLDQSVQNLVSLDRETMHPINPAPVSVGLTATSFIDSNLKRSLGLESSQSQFSQPIVATKASLPLQQLSFLGQLSSSVQTQSMASFQQDPLTCGIVTPTTLPELLASISDRNQTLLTNSLICQPSLGNPPMQLMQDDPMIGGMTIGPMLESATVADCLADTLLKIVPTSPITSTAVGVPTAASGFLNQRSCISQVTQMSDTELLRYINPSCFDQEQGTFLN